MIVKASIVARAIGMSLVLASTPLYGEERNLKALKHWEVEGKVHTISSDMILFQGDMQGILYVENEKGAIDGAFVECVVTL